MRKSKGVTTKAFAILLVVVLLLGGAVGGTFAWLMTSTEPVVNTFVAGDIQLELKEHVLDTSTGLWASPEAYTDVGNSSILALPGRTIQKDPTVTVLKGSEPCYLRVFVKISWEPAADSEFAQFEYSDWFAFDQSWTISRIFDGTYATNDKYVGYDIYELRYNGVVDALEETKSVQVMNGMTIPDTLDNDAISAMTGAGMTFVAQAIQSDGFDSATDAFAAAGYPDGWDPSNQNVESPDP